MNIHNDNRQLKLAAQNRCLSCAPHFSAAKSAAEEPRQLKLAAQNKSLSCAPRFSAAVGSERGSVLTEFLIVAPLYLVLFGALLLSHDMLRVKNKILMLDNFVTIAGTHRLMRGNDEAISTKVKSSWGDFMPGSVRTPLMIANQYESSEGKSLGNNWNAVYAGRVDVEYKLPASVYSLLSVQRVVFGGENDPWPPKSFRFYSDPQSGEFPSERECRFHVIQRHWTSKNSKKGYDRTAESHKLIGEQIMSNVLKDSWLFAQDVQGTAEVESNDSTYKQQLTKYAE
ncbi:MAG: hypothetical protein IKR81_15190 [Victivallales bacterium]|nr:hypothetical protein [Victivallales bacterium]